MVRIKYILMALLALAIGIGAAVYLSQGEEKKVKRQFDLLSEWISKDPDETAIGMAKKMQKIGELFDDPCQLELAVESFSGNYTREEISRYVARRRSRFVKLSLRFFDPEITFPEKGAANVNVTARLTGQTTGGESVRETRELECLLKKIENKWLFSHVEVVEVLKK